MRLVPRARARERARARALAFTLRHALLLAPALLASSCGMLDARLEARTACITLPEYGVPGAAGAGTISTELSYDLGSALPILSEPGVSYTLRARDVTLALESDSPIADLGGLEAFAASVVAPAGRALPEPELVRYARSAGGDAHPVSITAPATSDADLAPYVTGGWLRVRATGSGTLPSTPWRATVTACFLLQVDVDYASQL